MTRALSVALGLALALSLAACVAGEFAKESTYLAEEYGAVEVDGRVAGGDEQPGFRVWVHKSKPRMIVGLDEVSAFTAGTIHGASYGAAKPELPKEAYAQAAARYFAQIGRTDCSVTGQRPILNTGAEFDYVCTGPDRPVSKS